MKPCEHKRTHIKEETATQYARIGCLDCDEWLQPVRMKTERLYTRAEVLAFGERVREACLKQALRTENECLGLDEAIEAVDVARLLEEDK